MAATDRRGERLEPGASASAGGPALGLPSTGPGTAPEVSGVHALPEGRRRASYLPESPFPMWLFDRGSGKVLAANQAAVRAYGYTRTELLACHVGDICPGELLDAVRARAAARTGTNVRQRRKDGTTFETDVVMTDTGEDERAVTMVLLQLKSREQHGENEGAREGGVTPTQQAGRGQAVADPTFESRSRTLLGRATPTAQLLEPAPGERDPGHLKRLTDAVSRRSDLAADLRFPSWEPTSFVAVDAHELAEQAHERVRDRAHDKCVEVHLYCTCPRVWVRVRPFADALFELLHNAVRAAATHCPVVVEVQDTNEGDVLWQIQDSGEGMPGRVLAELGQPLRSPWGGFGLGVALAWAVIERHGGLLRFESAPGVGTTTSIWLPGARERQRVQGELLSGAASS
jgi:PAS domain S-box-containing protein